MLKRWKRALSVLLVFTMVLGGGMEGNIAYAKSRARNTNNLVNLLTDIVMYDRDVDGENGSIHKLDGRVEFKEASGSGSDADEEWASASDADRQATATSSNASVATVTNKTVQIDEDGNFEIEIQIVDDAKAGEEAEIKIQYGKHEDVTKVTVVAEKESETTITLTPPALGIPEGETITLWAEVIVDGQNFGDENITWKSSNPQVAAAPSTGSSRGVSIKGLSVGETVITATVNGVSAKCIFTVFKGEPIRPVSTIWINGNNSVIVGGTLELRAHLSPVNSSRDVTWSSSNETVATVQAEETSHGNDVRAIVTTHAVGEAVITITANDGSGVSAQMRIASTDSVVEVTSLKIMSDDGNRVSVGGTLYLYEKILPWNATDKDAIWTSSDESIAFVEEYGTLMGKKAGKVQITATAANGVKNSMWITVVEGDVVNSILLDGSQVMYVGKASWWNVEIYPENQNRKLEWTSDHPEIASVVQDEGDWQDWALVTGVKPGKATITLTIVGSGKSASQEVTVLPEAVVPEQDFEVKTMSFTRPAYRLMSGYDMPMITQLNLEPMDALNNKAKEWKTSDPKVVTIDKDGEIKAVGRGKADISFTTGGKTAKCTVTVPEILITCKDTLNLKIGTERTVVAEIAWATEKEQEALNIAYNEDRLRVRISSDESDETTGVSKYTIAIAAKAVGTDQVTLIVGGKKAVITVNVTEDAPAPSVDEKLDNIITEKIIEELNSTDPKKVIAAVNQVVASAAKEIKGLGLQVMDPAVANSLRNLEELLTQTGKFEVNDSVGDGVTAKAAGQGIAVNEVVGALLNMGTDYGVSVKPVLKVDLASTPANLPTGVTNQVAIDIKLFAEATEGAKQGETVGEITTLQVPVQITMERPAILSDVPDNKIVIYHYHGGNVTTIAPTVNADGTLTFVVDSFSTFIFAEKPVSTATRSSGKSGGSVRDASIHGQWILDTTGWWFKTTAGGYPVNEWALINSQWYHFDIAGYMQTGWLQVNGVWYYFQPQGNMVSNDWVFYNNQWYFFNADGSLAILKTVPGGYYVGADGAWVH